MFGPLVPNTDSNVQSKVARIFDIRVRLRAKTAMSDSNRPIVALVTGASTGLGLAIAKRLINETTYHLFLTARPSSLERFKQAGIEESNRINIRALDVTDAQQRALVIGEIEQRYSGLDILVNNAGYSYRAVLEEAEEDDLQAQLQVNFIASIELARMVLPAMRARRSGKIISLSSVGGMMAMPTMAIYSASKFALEGAFESLWYEVKPWNINVTLVQPGFINSSSFKNTKLTVLSKNSLLSSRADYHAHYASMSRFIARLMHRAWATPDDVAEKVLFACTSENPPLRLPATADAVIFSMMRRFLPRRLYHYILYRALPSIKYWGKTKNLNTRKLTTAQKTDLEAKQLKQSN